VKPVLSFKCPPSRKLFHEAYVRGHFELDAPFKSKLARRFHGGQFDTVEKVWKYPPTADFLRSFEKRRDRVEYAGGGVGELEMEKRNQVVAAIVHLGSHTDAAEREARKHNKRVEKAAAIKQADDVDVEMPVKTAPFVHQKKAFAIGMKLNGCALLMEQRTGKTLVAIALVGERHRKCGVQRVVVACPNTVTDVWDEQFIEHADFKYQLVISNAKKVRKAGRIENLFKPTKAVQVLVVNYEALRHIRKQLKRWKPDFAIADEMQRIKHRSAAVSRSMHDLRRVLYKLGMTGTPVTDRSPVDVFSQYKFVDERIFGGSFPKFRGEYLRMGGYMEKQVVGFRRPKRLARLAHSIAFRVRRRDVFEELPPVDQKLYVDLSKKTRRFYDVLDKAMVARIGDKHVSADIVLTKLMRLQQITGGFVPLSNSRMLGDDAGEVTQVGSEKLDALRDFLEDFPSDRKLVVVCRFVPEIRAVVKLGRELGYRTAALEGRTPRAKRKLLRRRFLKRKSPRLLVVQEQVGGVGLDFSSAATMVFYSWNYSWVDYDQMRSRLLGPNQKEAATYIHLIARNTYDAISLKALNQKGNVAEYIVDHLNPVKHKGASMTKKKGVVKVDFTDVPGEESDPVKETVDKLNKELSTKRRRNQATEENDDMKKKSKKEKTSTTKKSNGAADPNAVTLAEICEAKGVAGVAMRKALRGSKIKKPGDSWRWPKGHPDIAKVEKLAKELK
jgi:hypothetical protein